MDERLRMRIGVSRRNDTRSEPQPHHRGYPSMVIVTDNRRDTRSEPQPRAGILRSSPPLQANPKPNPTPQQQLLPTIVNGATSRGDSPSQPRSRRSDDEVPVRRPLIDTADHRLSVGDLRRNEEARTHVALRIREPPRETEEQRERSADERRERCYKYSQKALGFAICTFFPYLTTASSSSAAGKTARKFSMAAFFIAVCADFFSWRTKPRDGRALVYLSSFSLMLMTFLMFISFDGYYACAIPVVPLIIGAGLVQHILSSGGHQQNTNTDDDEFNKVLSDTFDLSSQILNWGSLVTAFTTATNMHSFSAASQHSFVGFMLLLTVILSLYLMMATTVRSPFLTRHVNYLYSILPLPLLIMAGVFITNKMNG